jgi:hypothetical protein
LTNIYNHVIIAATQRSYNVFLSGYKSSVSDSLNLITHDLFTEVVARSPSPTNKGNFAKGLLVNQYYTAINDYNYSSGASTNDIGVDSLSRISTTLNASPFLGKDAFVSMSNSTEEMIYAEEIGWKTGLGTNGWKWSGRVAPYSMIKNSAVFIQSKYEG